MTGAHGRIQSAGEGPRGEHARRGATQKPAHPAGPGAGPARAREAHLLRLQRTYGNAAVQWHLQRTRTPATPAPAPPTSAPSAPRVQRWKDDGHVRTTEEAAKAVFPATAPFFKTIGMSKAQFVTSLGQASLTMDKIVAHLGDRFAPGFGETKFYSFTATLISSALGDLLPGNQRAGKTRRGIKGEGPDHGEAGYYDIPRAQAIAGNVARTDKYVNEAVQAFASGDYALMIAKLGDACHVAADRGSHAEGGQGEGHDTRMPDPAKNEHGTDLNANPPFMEGWADNDVISNNRRGYIWGLQCTLDVLSDFFDQAQAIAPANQEGVELEQDLDL